MAEETVSGCFDSVLSRFAPSNFAQHDSVRGRFLSRESGLDSRWVCERVVLELRSHDSWLTRGSSRSRFLGLTARLRQIGAAWSSASEWRVIGGCVVLIAGRSDFRAAVCDSREAEIRISVCRSCSCWRATGYVSGAAGRVVRMPRITPQLSVRQLQAVWGGYLAFAVVCIVFGGFTKKAYVGGFNWRHGVLAGVVVWLAWTAVSIRGKLLKRAQSSTGNPGRSAAIWTAAQLIGIIVAGSIAACGLVSNIVIPSPPWFSDAIYTMGILLLFRFLPRKPAVPLG